MDDVSWKPVEYQIALSAAIYGADILWYALIGLFYLKGRKKKSYWLAEPPILAVGWGYLAFVFH